MVTHVREASNDLFFNAFPIPPVRMEALFYFMQALALKNRCSYLDSRIIWNTLNFFFILLISFSTSYAIFVPN